MVESAATHMRSLYLTFDGDWNSADFEQIVRSKNTKIFKSSTSREVATTSILFLMCTGRLKSHLYMQ